MTQPQAKGLPDCRVRDIRRRVDVIQKKLADLQELGIPCAFCYSSVRNTGSLFTLGDTCITDVIERHKNEILRNLIDGNFEQSDSSTMKEIHLILPPLSAPLDKLSRNQMQSLIVGILKDLGLRWSDPRPSWWPSEIPFVPPRCVPENFAGNWTQALKKVIESVYSYFKYDVNTYIASRLDSLQEEENSSVPVVEHPRSSSEARLTETQQSGEDNHAGSLQDQRTPTSSTDKSWHRKQQPAKLVSSFTVENILMGTQSYSGSASSTDSESPASADTEFEPISYNNPATQPSIRYTKFTMVTPSSMAAEKRKKLAGADLSERAMTGKASHKQLGEQDKCFKTGETSSAIVHEHSVHCKNTVTAGSSGVSHTDSCPGINMMHSVIQSTGPSQLFPVPEVSLASRAASFHQSPIPQQFVVFYSASQTPGLQTVVYANAQAVPVAVTQPLSPNSSSPILTSVRSPMQSPTTITTVAPSSHLNSTAPTMPHIDTTATASTSSSSEASFIPIAPKTEEIRHRMALRDSENIKLFRKRTILKPRAPRRPKLPKPQKLRFHMTTVVKRAKRKPGGLVSMSVPPPSLGLHERSTDGRELIITPSPNLETMDNSQSGIVTSPSGSHSVGKLPLDKTGTNAPDSAEQPAAHPQAAVLKDSGYHLQFVKQSISHPAAVNRRGTRGCGKRTYTRRKRELTFHLYEDPTTNFKVKRACKRQQD